MDKKILEMLNDICKGLDGDLATSIDMAETDNDIIEIILTVAECRDRLLDHRAMILGRKDKKNGR